jgi:hypothetical protein
MYWLIRRWGLGSFAAAFAGFAYVFNGVTLSCLMWISYTAFLAWSPWVLGCTMAAWRNGGRWVPLCALASAMQVLAGAPEMLLLFWLLVGLLWVRDIFGKKGAASPTLSFTAPMEPNLFVPFWRSFGRLAAVVTLAGGITMVQMLPFFDLLAHSQRDRNFASSQWSMPGWGWANLIIPLFHCYQTPFGTSFQPHQYLISSYYLGAGVLTLAIAGAGLTRRRAGVILGGFALFCWLLALGPNGFFFEPIRRIFPWIGVVRYPVKFALFPVVLVPILAAWAIDKIALKTDPKYERWLVGLGIATLVAMGGIIWLVQIHPLPDDDPRAMAANAVGRALILSGLLGGLIFLKRFQRRVLRLALQIGILVLIPLDAFTHCPNIFPAFDTSNLAPGIWTAQLKQPPPKLGEGRAMTSPKAARYLDDGHGSDLALDFTARRMGEWYSLNLLDGIPKVDGALILCPAHFFLLWRNLYQLHVPFGQGLVDFLSVAWYSSADNPLLWTARTNFLPIITAGQRPMFVSDNQALQGIAANEFDPREIVYLPESARALVTVSNQTACKVLSSQIQAQKIEAEVESADSSLVVLSQAFYHLWRASVDGKPMPLFRANLAFQALQIPAGKHHIVLVYRDIYLWTGAAVSVISLAACGLLWVAKRGRASMSKTTAEDRG